MAIAETTLTPGCKVNLVLRILGLRPDGYHDLKTLFWPLAEPADTITIRPGKAGRGVTLTSDAPGLQGEHNLILAACRAFAEATGFAPDLDLHLEKRIPMGAGLGGGSSDGAAMLGFLNANAGDKALGHKELAALAGTLGADMPFFLLNAPAWATGTGGELTLLDRDQCTVVRGLHLALFCPPVHVSTAWAYKALDASRDADETRAPGGQALTAQNGSDIQIVSRRFLVLGNDFEPVVFQEYPELRALKEHLLGQGAGGALMSGSGASVFGLFRDAGTARRAAQGAADVIKDTAAYVCAM